MKKTIFVKNAVILTVSGLILRLIGVVFKVWLASKIGSEGIGLYQLVFSVYVLFGTFATSGISTAVTRLCANNANNKSGIKKIIKLSMALSLLIAAISLIILFFGANYISKSVISDKRTSLALKTLAFSLPFMGFCSCFRGYFISRRKATPPAITQIIEQFIRILTVIIAVKLTFSKGLSLCLAGVFLGDTVSEIICFLILYITYRIDIKKTKDNIKTKNNNYYSKIKEIAFPIMLGRYINSALRTAENIIVPKFLKYYNSAKNNAISQFGMIKGMALPLIFFPSTLLNSLSILLIPELSVAKNKCQKQIIASTVREVITTTSIISYILSAIFFFGGVNFGILIYKNETVGYLIKFLSPLVPLMYLDSICDGMLKGLNLQRFTFYVSVIDSSIRILLIAVILPRFGLIGFIGIMYFSNIFTGFLNINKLISVSGAKIKPYNDIFLPLLSAILSACLVDIVAKWICCSITLVYIILFITLSVVVYYVIISNITDFKIQNYL